MAASCKACEFHTTDHSKQETKVCCSFIQQYDETNPNTYEGNNLLVMTMDDLYKKYTLAEETIEFIGHAIALQSDTAYRKKPALPTVKKIQLYYESLTRFAGLKSPYIYPLYGLGELPQVCDDTVPCLTRDSQTSHSYWLHRIIPP